MASASAEKSLVQAHYDSLAMEAEREESQGSSSATVFGKQEVVAEDSGFVAGPASPGRLAARNGAATAVITQPLPATPLLPSRPALPPYSGPASSAHEAALEQQQQQQAHQPGSGRKKMVQRYPGLPALDYRLYQPPLFVLSSDKTTIKSSAPYLSATATALAGLVRAQATVPPKPMIEITGSRGNHRPDFAVKLNLMSLLVAEEPRRRLNYVRCVGRGELALRGGSRAAMMPTVETNSSAGAEEEVEAWCRRFCEDTAAAKVFVLERQVANLDLSWLEGQIRSLVAATGYRGAVSVTFPVAHARVVVQSPDRVNKFFTTVTTLFTGKSTYEVVKAVWPFATHKNGEIGRQCAVQSEETWWKEWRDPLRHAISTKRHGWVTNEDKLEALMEDVGKTVGAVDWGPNLST
ncbi:hypothetical protein CMQ_2829 [Grosmannia clavigera kw1407]|uniref:Uncharacterized protein n=1 Tax=Grosmannia clavigera (strain kw1407 / UAMH 11150) TaxID=655863 RepID=F0XI51_GROCL|nr:uncharacterized protein CMQ_2829 [Grosmannia clavigera kw1407]EFX02900.1 hypothetical protein CMQ_2829 [Grosmannia clavigera kw1407]